MTQPINQLHQWFLHHPNWSWLSYLPSLIWAGLIFWLSSQSYLPTLSTPWFEFLWKKTAHFLIYGGLYFWLWWSHRVIHQSTKNSAGLTIWWLSLVLLYAMSDELHQSFIANRHPAVADVAIDLFGAVSFSWSLWQYYLWPNAMTWLTNQLIPALKK